MSAVVASPEIAEIRDRFIALAVHLPCHEGWSWTEVDCRTYLRARKDGTPALELTYTVDDEILEVYFVGVHDVQMLRGGGR